jgi:hypothetical protein
MAADRGGHEREVVAISFSNSVENLYRLGRDFRTDAIST